MLWGWVANLGLSPGLYIRFVPQVNRGHSDRVRLCVITASGVRIDETEYSERLSVGEDKALSISKVTRQDNARTFICQVGADSQGVGESRTELYTYSE